MYLGIYRFEGKVPDLLADSGLPVPQVRLVGDVHRAVVGGERRV